MDAKITRQDVEFLIIVAYRAPSQVPHLCSVRAAMMVATPRGVQKVILAMAAVHLEGTATGLTDGVLKGTRNPPFSTEDPCAMFRLV